MDEELKQFHKFIYDLHMAEGFVCYKDRDVFPTKLRPKVLYNILFLFHHYQFTSF